MMYLEPVTKEQLESIYNEFQITEESFKEGVKYLEEWIRRQPHLPNVDDEDILSHFLLRCKFDIERTKKHLEAYYCAKISMAEIFSNRNAKSTEFRKCFDLATFLPLPKLTSDGVRIYVYRVDSNAVDSMPSKEEFLKTGNILSAVDLKLNLSSKDIIICDFVNTSLPFITLMLMCLRRLLTLSTKVIPYRHQKIYLINPVPAIEPLIFISKKLAKKEIGDRIKIWKKKPELLVEELPENILPSNYGGTERSFEELKELWFEEIKSYTAWLQEEEKLKADLSRQPKGSNRDLSFNNMEID